MAKRYLSHEELGISFAEWGGLFGFKAIAEASIVLKPMPMKEILRDVRTLLENHPGEHFFDMGISCEAQECGSVACIGGTVGMFMKIPSPALYVMEVAQTHSPLHALYYPRWNNGRQVALKAPRGVDANERDFHFWERITLKMAAQAVDNFLRTGKPNWDKVIPAKWRAKQQAL